MYKVFGPVGRLFFGNVVCIAGQYRRQFTSTSLLTINQQASLYNRTLTRPQLARVIAKYIIINNVINSLDRLLSFLRDHSYEKK